MNEMELQTTLDPIEMDMGDPEIVYSPVLPNPEGEPTDDLTKVKIQGNIYQIKDPEVHEWARAENKPTYTKAEVGLGEVDNTSDLDKPISTATQEALDNKVDKVAGKGLSEEDFTHTLKNKLDGIEAGAEVNTVNSVAGKTGDITLDKSDVGLGNVDNTSDMNKPVSTATQEALQGLASATQTALNGKVDNSTLNNYYTKTETDTALGNKVDKAQGKGLSENDFTDTLKDKLDGIEEQANKTVVDNSVTATSTNPVESKAIYNLLNDLLPEATETGNPISITNASGLNAKSLKVELEPIQDTSGGEPSPEHICPINGRTQTTVKRFGKNLYDNSLANGRSATASGLTFSCTDGLYKIQGLCNNATINAWILGEYNGTRAIFIIPKGTYILSVTDGRGVRIYSYDGTTRKSWDCKPTSQTPATFNEDTPITAMKPVDHISGTTYNYTFHIQIEAGDTATDYEPYVTPVDTTISFGQTVYGGEVNVTSGGTSDEWGYIASYNGETLSGEWLSDRDKYVSGTTPTIGAEVVYKKTPTTINTPANEISLLKGNNTIVGDGDMELIYSKIPQ